MPNLFTEHEEEVSNLPAVIKEPTEPCPYSENATQAYLWARTAWWRKWDTLKGISQAIEVPQWKIKKWIYEDGGWKDLKAKENQRQLTKLIDGDLEKIDNLLTKIFRVLDASVEKVLDENQVLTIQEFGSLTSSAEKVFKIRQLLMGSPTEIFAGDGAKGEDVTWSTMIEKLREVDIIDVADFKKVADKKASKARVVESKFAKTDEGKS